MDTVDADLWVSLAEAGRRQVPPVSRAAVSKRVGKLKELGRLTTRKGPRGEVLVNIVAYLRAVQEETDPAQALRNGTAPLLDGDDDAAVEAPAAGSEGDANYHRSRAKREAFNAENARLDLEERLGRIADKDDVEHRTMQVFRKVRDRLLGMPAGLSERLAAQPDARAVRALLQTEIRHLLTTLADELDHMAEEEEGAEPDGDGDE